MQTAEQIGATPEDRIDRLAQAAADLGREIVDVSGFLETLDAGARTQLDCLRSLSDGARNLIQVNTAVTETLGGVATAVNDALAELSKAETFMSRTATEGRAMTERIGALDLQAGSIQPMLDAVRENNEQIAAIAAQVNMLAINAKIEAARAGEAGHGFSVVADAINALSQRTRSASDDVTNNVASLTRWVEAMRQQTASAAADVRSLSESGEATFNVVSRANAAIAGSVERTGLISTDLNDAAGALTAFQPQLERISDAVHEGVGGIRTAHQRVSTLVDTSERIVQDSVALGGTSVDLPFIADVQARAARISALFEEALSTGRITEAELFETRYRPLRSTDPPQVMAPFTSLTDSLLPQVQEPALEIDDRVVFCAAVNRTGYLPTHNRKFSRRQGRDPVWNAANCRNRRVFDDRVGLKAGQNTHPFLLQVYRRDMGGGQFALMKDLSAPITVRGRHWGGLRLAYRF